MLILSGDLFGYNRALNGETFGRNWEPLQYRRSHRGRDKNFHSASQSTDSGGASRSLEVERPRCKRRQSLDQVLILNQLAACFAINFLWETRHSSPSLARDRELIATEESELSI